MNNDRENMSKSEMSLRKFLIVLTNLLRVFDKSLLFHAETLSSFLSTTVISISGQLEAMTDIVDPPTYPAPIQQIDRIGLFFILFKLPKN